MWVVMDSNHRRHSQQIYSLPHLATLVTTRCSFKASAKVVNISETTACFVKYFMRRVFFPAFHGLFYPNLHYLCSENKTNHIKT